MNDRQDKNLQGQIIQAPPNPGTWIGKMWRARICSLLTCLMNPKIIVPIVDANGISVPKESTITMGVNGWTAILPPMVSGSSGGSSGGSSVTQFRYKSNNTTYITCRAWDGTSEGAVDVNIALPFTLRTSPGVGFEIWPAYILNDLVYAIQSDHTGVVVSSAELTWLEVSEGRYWASYHYFKDTNNACAQMKRLVVGSAPVSV